jgi:hypothetical protein
MAKAKLTKEQKDWLKALRKWPPAVEVLMRLDGFIKKAQTDCLGCPGRRIHIYYTCKGERVKYVGDDGKDGLSLWPEED